MKAFSLKLPILPLIISEIKRDTVGCKITNRLRARVDKIRNVAARESWRIFFFRFCVSSFFFFFFLVITLFPFLYIAMASKRKRQKSLLNYFSAAAPTLQQTTSAAAAVTKDEENNNNVEAMHVDTEEEEMNDKTE